MFEESDMNWKDMLKAWKEFKIKGVVITESSNIEGDALLLKRMWGIYSIGPLDIFGREIYKGN